MWKVNFINSILQQSDVIGKNPKKQQGHHLIDDLHFLDSLPAKENEDGDKINIECYNHIA